MARRRQARRCTAHRPRDGLRCEAYAIVGGTVCWAHGGAASQVRAAATARVQRQQIYMVMLREVAYQRALVAGIEAERVADVAEVLEVPADQEGGAWAWAAALVTHPELGDRHKRRVAAVNERAERAARGRRRWA